MARLVRSVLAGYRYGAGDPTTRLGPSTFWRATFTPDGPATLHLDWRDGEMRAQAWGPGGDWLLAQVPAMTGELDPGHVFTGAHPIVMQAQRHHPDVRFGASGTLYHELLPNILGQRITAGEALRQWRLLVQRLGEPAPGPRPDLRLPPPPQALVDRPSWWFHPLGIEVKRAETVRQVARHADRLHQWVTLPSPADQLALLPGVGQWTIGTVLATAVGDPDAVAVGDFHLKNVVVHAFTGRPRGTDEQMLELLEPYAGQRGRVVRLLLLDGHRAPKFGPRRPVMPLNRW
jgi:3-methyladenine DNA glycosylase/8-oxoguanine DNA glycosylase